MSSFRCDKCGADNIGTEQGYESGCECYSNIDSLEDAVVAKANREYVMVSREMAGDLHDYYLDEIVEQERYRAFYAEGTDAHKKWSAHLADTRAKAKAVSDLLCKEPSGGR